MFKRNTKKIKPQLCELCLFSLRRHYPDQVMGMISARNFEAPLLFERTKIILFCSATARMGRFLTKSFLVFEDALFLSTFRYDLQRCC